MNVTLHIDGKPVTLENVARGSGELSFTLAGKSYVFRSHTLPGGGYLLERHIARDMQQRMRATVWRGKGVCHVQLDALAAKISEPAAVASQAAERAELSPRAPMPGLVRQILVKAGDCVKQGQALAVIEAMKLQMTLSAGAAAKVEAILVREGEMIPEGAELVRLIAIKEAV